MKLGILDGKIWDICSRLDGGHKRDDLIPDKDYLDLPMKDWVIGDTWDFTENKSLKDSPLRLEICIKPKTVLELKIEALESRLNILEAKKIE